MTNELLALLGVWLGAIGLLFGVVLFRRWRLDRQKTRLPCAEKLLRAPGEGLRRKLEEMEEQLSTELCTAVTLPLLCVGVFLAGRDAQRPGPTAVGVSIAGVIAFVLICCRVWKLLNKKGAYRLGLLGERAVGEELNQLMLEGCHVFHDVPNGSHSNIDHVLVAPSGLYAVETKTRRKKADGRDAHKVVWDGRTLRFGSGAPEDKCLAQTTRQASQLSDWLSKATGEAVRAQPVLALPGWYVDPRGRGEVIVVSGRAVKVLATERPVFEDAQIRRMIHQLDQRCRDVEF